MRAGQPDECRCLTGRRDAGFSSSHAPRTQHGVCRVIEGDGVPGPAAAVHVTGSSD